MLFNSLKNCREFECRVLCSDLVLDELGAYFTEEEVSSMLEPFLDLIEFVDYTKEETIQVRLVVNKILGVHFADVLHALVSRDNNAVIITRDKHFDLLSDIVTVLKPEEVRFD